MSATPTNNDRSTFHSYFNRSVNFLGDVGYKAIHGGILPSMVLGYIGGWMSGVGTHVGMAQGCYSGIYYNCVYKVCDNYITNNRGDRPDDISPNSAKFLMGVNLICTVTLPIFMTLYSGQWVGGKITERFGEAAESWVTWLLTSSPTREYGMVSGLGVSVLPTIVQHAISYWSDQESKARRRKL